MSGVFSENLVKLKLSGITAEDLSYPTVSNLDKCHIPFKASRDDDIITVNQLNLTALKFSFWVNFG